MILKWCSESDHQLNYRNPQIYTQVLLCCLLVVSNRQPSKTLYRGERNGVEEQKQSGKRQLQIGFNAEWQNSPLSSTCMLCHQLQT